VCADDVGACGVTAVDAAPVCVPGRALDGGFVSGQRQPCGATPRSRARVVPAPARVSLGALTARRTGCALCPHALASAGRTRVGTSDPFALVGVAVEGQWGFAFLTQMNRRSTLARGSACGGQMSHLDSAAGVQQGLREVWRQIKLPKVLS